jgi:thymidylate synthase
VSVSIFPHIEQVNRSRVSTDHLSFCHLLVLYQLRHACVLSRYWLRSLSFPLAYPSLGFIVDTRGFSVLILAIADRDNQAWRKLLHMCEQMHVYTKTFCREG